MSQVTQRDKYLSPPISPKKSGAISVKEAVSTSINSNSTDLKAADGDNHGEISDIKDKPQEETGSWMVIDPYPRKNKRDDILNFVGSYNLDKFKTKESPKKKKKYNPPSSREDQIDSEPVSKKIVIELPEKLNHSDNGLNSQKYGGYGTRSKNKTNGYSSGNTSDETSNCKYQGKSAPSHLRVDQTVLNAIKAGDKSVFLKLSSVQFIHDVDLVTIPNFEPNIKVDQQKLAKICKKYGFKIESLETYSRNLVISAVLRLTPDQFSDTKKRFFAEKARKHYAGLTFKKTDAQKACKIDVNKASKIYEIYQQCGLLEDNLFNYDG